MKILFSYLILSIISYGLTSATGVNNTFGAYFLGICIVLFLYEELRWVRLIKRSNRDPSLTFRSGSIKNTKVTTKRIYDESGYFPQPMKSYRPMFSFNKEKYLYINIPLLEKINWDEKEQQIFIFLNLRNLTWVSRLKALISMLSFPLILFILCQFVLNLNDLALFYLSLITPVVWALVTLAFREVSLCLQDRFVATHQKIDTNVFISALRKIDIILPSSYWKNLSTPVNKRIKRIHKFSKS